MSDTDAGPGGRGRRREPSPGRVEPRPRRTRKSASTVCPFCILPAVRFLGTFAACLCDSVSLDVQTIGLEEGGQLAPLFAVVKKKPTNSGREFKAPPAASVTQT